MLQSKKQNLIKRIHHQNRQKIFKDKRQRQILMSRMREAQLQYFLCALVSGQNDGLGHTKCSHCQQFVVKKHEQFHRILVQMKMEDVKQILKETDLPRYLCLIMNIIQDKTLEEDQIIMTKSWDRRSNVINSISRLVSFMSSDQQIVMIFGKQAVSLFIGRLKNDCLYEIDDNQQNAIIGLSRLIQHPEFTQITYLQLRQFNFQFYVQKHLKRMTIDSSHLYSIDKTKNLIILLRFYLQNQYKIRHQMPNGTFYKLLGKYIPQTINKAMKNIEINFLESIMNEIIEQLLTVSLFIRFQYTEQADLLRKIKLYKKKQLIRMLAHYSQRYSSYVKLSYFTDVELRYLLQAAKQLEGSSYYHEYLDLLAQSLIKMIQASNSQKENIYRLKNILISTNSIYLFQKQDIEEESFSVFLKIMEEQQSLEGV